MKINTGFFFCVKVLITDLHFFETISKTTASCLQNVLLDTSFLPSKRPLTPKVHLNEKVFFTTASSLSK
jgi:hypothetical protein